MLLLDLPGKVDKHRYNCFLFGPASCRFSRRPKVFILKFIFSCKTTKTRNTSLTGFSNLFNVSARLFCTLFSAQSRKILSKFSNLSAIIKHGKKNFVTSIVHLSSNRLWARTNENARITWVIMHHVFRIKAHFLLVASFLHPT